ncbi:hypothetical protein O9992_20805 [Vibrio lentus]|nr:hypothetical protein [Vibrio lentus]
MVTFEPESSGFIKPSPPLQLLPQDTLISMTCTVGMLETETPTPPSQEQDDLTNNTGIRSASNTHRAPTTLCGGLYSTGRAKR